MSEKIKEYLRRQCNYLRSTQVPSRFDPSRDRVATIVEPRDHAMLEAVIRNVIFHLPDWNLHLFTSKKVSEILPTLLPEWKYRLTILPQDNLTPTEYNNLLRSLEFWRSGREEYILIFQTDSLILRIRPENPIETYFKYGYVGAPFAIGDAGDYVRTPNGRVMNGGFSFRRRSAMIKGLTLINQPMVENYRRLRGLHRIHPNNWAEDVYFVHALELLNIRLPNDRVAQKFCIEDIVDSGPIGPIGLHGHQYGFFDRNVDQLLESAAKIPEIRI
jgi:hypothetical protein